MKDGDKHAPMPCPDTVRSIGNPEGEDIRAMAAYIATGRVVQIPGNLLDDLIISVVDRAPVPHMALFTAVGFFGPVCTKCNGPCIEHFDSADVHMASMMMDGRTFLAVSEAIARGPNGDGEVSAEARREIDEVTKIIEKNDENTREMVNGFPGELTVEQVKMIIRMRRDRINDLRNR